MKYSLETSTSCILETETGLQEEKEAHSHEVKIFQDELAGLDK